MSDLDTREIARVEQLMESGKPTTIFVFGSNRAGAHGGGAARVAFKKYGAEYGKAEGLSGRSYALPTVDEDIDPLPLEDVEAHVATFLQFADSRKDLRFAVTRVGCGVAGFTDAEIAPLFANAPANCELPEGWVGGRCLVSLRLHADRFNCGAREAANAPGTSDRGASPDVRS